MLAKVETALKEARALCEERAVIDAHAASYGEVIEKASEYSIDDPRTHQTIASATATIDVCQARRKFLAKAVPKALNHLRMEVITADDAWYAKVNPKIEAIRLAVRAALEPYYLECHRHLTEDMKSMRVPAIFRAEEALFQGDWQRDESLLGNAKAFLSHVRRYAKILDINIEEP